MTPEDEMRQDRRDDHAPADYWTDPNPTRARTFITQHDLDTIVKDTASAFDAAATVKSCTACDGLGGVSDAREMTAWERSGRNPELAPSQDECPVCHGSGAVAC